MTPKLYLAGPAVFLPDAAAVGEARKQACAEAGFEGLWPGDSPAQDAAAIFQACCEMVDACHAVLADLTPFRGPGADPGTAVELGYAVARGKPIFAWSEATGEYRARVAHRRDAAGRPIDADGWLVEDMGLADNLMLAVPAGALAPIQPDFAAALAAARRHYFGR